VLERDAAHAERHAGGQIQEPGRLAGAHQHRGQMSGDGDPAGGAVRVVDGVRAGGVLVQIGGDLVDVPQDAGRRDVEVGQRGGGGAQPSHGGGGVDAAAHHIAHDERGLVGDEGDDVEPVAADLQGGAGGRVAGGDLQA